MPHNLFFLLISILSFSAQAELNVALVKGHEIVAHQLNDASMDEICSIPSHLKNADYKGPQGSKDIETEKQLCSLSIYLEGPTKETGGVALCPKIQSTSAALEFQSILEGQSKSELEKVAQCGSRRLTSKLTNFKTTDNDRTCTYVPGAILSYHLSRALGNILNVPVMVLRTVAIPKFKEVAQRALSMNLNSNLKQSYKNYIQAFEAPSKWDYKRYIFTSDYKQVFGMLKDPVKGDSLPPQWVEEISAQRFEALDGVKQVFSEASITKLIGNTLNQKNLQLLMDARDYSDLIVLDQLTSQGDRYTGANLSQLEYYYYLEDGKNLKSVKKRDVDSKKVEVPENAMLLTRLVSSDNDCTFLNENTNATRGYVARLRHLHPKTYRGVLQLAKSWQEDSGLRDFLANGLAMDPPYIAKFSVNLLNIATTLKQNCLSHKLLLDLDSDVFFTSGTGATHCELNE